MQAICIIAIVSQRLRGARIAIRNLAPANVGRWFRRRCMDAQQRRYLERRYRARDWHGRGGRARPVIKDFNIDGSEIRRWSLQRVQRDERAKPPVIRSIWRHGETMNQLLAVDVFECASVKAAHDQLVEALANMESDAIDVEPTRTCPVISRLV
jgi:hypothetical protein